MFCTKCGKELTDNQNFCSECGHPNGEHSKTLPLTTLTEEHSNEVPRVTLIRRAHAFSENYDISLDIPGLSVWEYSRIDSFDPLHKLEPFKRDLANDLMEFSKYEISRDIINEVVEEIYPISRKILLTNLKKWFLEQCMDYTEKNKGPFVYNVDAIADSNIKYVYGISKYLKIITCELKDWEGLQTTKAFLKIAEAFYCENNDYYGRNFFRNGYLLRLREFSEAKIRYDELMKQINEAIVLFNPNLKEEIDKETKIADEKETKIAKIGKTSIATRVICALTFPLLLIFQFNFLPVFGVYFHNFPALVIIIVGAILFGLLIVADIKIQNIPLIITLNVIGLLLFFPLCWGISALVSWVSKILIFVLGIIVIAMVMFFHGDRTNP